MAYPAGDIIVPGSLPIRSVMLANGKLSPYAVIYYDDLPQDSPIRQQIASADCYLVDNGRPVVLLGGLVESEDGLHPADFYRVADAIRLTREARASRHWKTKTVALEHAVRERDEGAAWTRAN
jgi:hypothetical protein